MSDKGAAEEERSEPGAERGLSTTAYALLGLLALREWSNYELAEQMRRGVGDLWSAARSMVFLEPKRLVAEGLATARKEMVGRRPRSIYSITPAGRAALKAWLTTPGAPPAMQFEGVLKVLLADSDDIASSRASIGAARDWALGVQEVGREVAQEYLEGRGPFQDRILQVSLIFDFLWSYTDAVIEWADRAGARIDGARSRKGARDVEAPFRRALATPAG